MRGGRLGLGSDRLDRLTAITRVASSEKFFDGEIGFAAAIVDRLVRH